MDLPIRLATVCHLISILLTPYSYHFGLAGGELISEAAIEIGKGRVMEATPQKIEEVLEILNETPHRLVSCSQQLTSKQLHGRPERKSWSVNEILAHLRACADVWGKDITSMLEQARPTLPHVSPHTWLRKTDDPDLEFQASMTAFQHQRRGLLKQLKSLEIADWQPGAVIKGRTHTVFSQVRRMALHE